MTRGARGALLAGGGPGRALAVPAPAVAGGDPCGAGDRFAAAAAGRARRRRAALRGGPGARSPRPRRSSPRAAPATARSARRRAGDRPARPRWPRGCAPRGGTVVATGGCFDLLHAGHVRTLEAARALGDCLVVCLNSDASVRRLKGPDRPLVGQDDRAAVLAALALRRRGRRLRRGRPARRSSRELRPDVWVKGGDYAVAELPEAEVARGLGRPRRRRALPRRAAPRTRLIRGGRRPVRD